MMTPLMVTLVAVMILMALILLTERATNTKTGMFQATVNYIRSTATAFTVWISDK